MNTQTNTHLTDKQIKQTGSVYTPSKLVEAMLDKVPYDKLIDTDSWFVEPCCGTGAIVIGILNRRVANGVEPKVALTHIIANELLTDSFKILRQNLIEWAKANGVEPHLVDEQIFNMDMWDFFNVMRGGSADVSKGNSKSVTDCVLGKFLQ